MRAARHQRRGFVLIVALVVCFAIASLVLTLGRLARTEALASANQLATYEAANVEKGAEQFVRAIASDLTQLDTLEESDFEAVPVGTGFFWIVRPDYLDDDLPEFGLVDEASKIPLNSASTTTEQLQYLSDMTPDIASAIVEWRGGAADSGRYGSSGYTAKGAPYEVPEELMLVQGVTREMYYGSAATTDAGGTTSSTLVGNDGPRSAGWQHYFTPFASPQTDPAPPNPQAPPSLINVNQAPRDVLVALFPIPSSAVDSGLQQRAAAVSANPTDKEWAQAAFPGLGQEVRDRLTGRGTIFSADIVAAAGNGRAFKRVRIVIDTAQTPPRIVYRRDITDQGFPLDASILTNLRAGGSPGEGNASSRTRSSAR